MDKGNNAAAMGELSEFLLTPYKVSLAVFIQQFAEHRASHTQKEIGAFCVLIMRLIQGLDLSYAQLLTRMRSEPRLNQELVVQRVANKIERMRNSGACHMLDLVNGLKSLVWINRTSFLGIFVRRFHLYFDKLSFRGLMQLFEDFKAYVTPSDDSSDDGPNFENEMFLMNQRHYDPGLTSDNATQNMPQQQAQQQWNSCPKQVQCWAARQAQLLSVNERQALPPAALEHALIQIEKQTQGQTALRFDPSYENFRRQTQRNDLQYVRFLNAMRMREYTKARDALFAYFDGAAGCGGLTTNNTATAAGGNCGGSSSRCWSAFNLALLHQHFDQPRLAFEALKECVSSAQDAGDERCLAYALTCIARLMVRACGHMATRNNSDPIQLPDQPQELRTILKHLNAKATKLDLPHLAAVSCLLHEQLPDALEHLPHNSTDHKSDAFNALKNNPTFVSHNYSATGATVSGSGNNNRLPSAELLAVKYSLSDLLLASHATRIAQFVSVGATHLAALGAQTLLNVHVVEAVGDQLVFVADEHVALALTSVSAHIWRHLGEFESARRLLLELAARLFSPYSSKMLSACKVALAQIDFERHLLRDQLASAEAAADLLAMHDQANGRLLHVELQLRRGDRQKAVEELQFLLQTNGSERDHAHVRVRALLLRAKALDDVASLFDALHEASHARLRGLELQVLLELAWQLSRMGQLSQSLRLLRSNMIRMLSELSQSDVARALHLLALNQTQLVHRDCSSLERRSLAARQKLNEVLASNRQAIEITTRLGDRRLARRCWRLQAEVQQMLGNTQQRNWAARQLRLLCEQDTIVT